MVPYLFYPLLASLIALILSFAFFLYAKQNGKYVSLAKYILGGLAVASVVTILVCFSVYYVREIKTSDEITGVNSVVLAIGAAVFVVIFALLYAFFGRKSNPKTETKSVTYAAVCIALSFALSYIRLFKLPQGGSITLVSLLPLMLYSQMFGVRKGLVAGLIYGILQAIQDPYILHPAQFLLDYPIAFASIGLTAIFTQKGIKGGKGIALFGAGAVLAVSLRYAAHVISGIFAFSMYAAEGYSAVAWGFLYNTFAFADMAIALTVGIVMLGNSAFRKMVNKTTFDSLPVLRTEVAAGGAIDE
ncbi:MAG: energy-coupled thiamine transporter ThiT [Clostridia bacterium]|nr:energy-coupled thiamine transporter ThiT [Clostridia bacterium]